MLDCGQQACEYATNKYYRSCPSCPKRVEVPIYVSTEHRFPRKRKESQRKCGCKNFRGINLWKNTYHFDASRFCLLFLFSFFGDGGSITWPPRWLELYYMPNTFFPTGISIYPKSDTLHVKKWTKQLFTMPQSKWRSIWHQCQSWRLAWKISHRWNTLILQLSPYWTVATSS